MKRSKSKNIPKKQSTSSKFCSFFCCKGTAQKCGPHFYEDTFAGVLDRMEFYKNYQGLKQQFEDDWPRVNKDYFIIKKELTSGRLNGIKIKKLMIRIEQIERIALRKRLALSEEKEEEKGSESDNIPAENVSSDYQNVQVLQNSLQAESA